MKNDYVVLSVQFYNDKQNQFTGKYYNYLLDKQLYFKYRYSFMEYPFTFEITSGYNYRGSKVRAMEARNIGNNESVDDFKIIKDFWFDTTLKRGVCIDSDFPDKISIESTIALQNISAKMSRSWESEQVYSCNCASSSNNVIKELNCGGGGGSCSTNSSYIPKDATPINGMFGDNNITITTDFRTINLTETIDKIEKEFETLKNNKDKNEKENNKMNKFGLNIKFGKGPISEIRMSMYGPAFYSIGGWFANKDGEYINVDGFLFGEENYCYMLPVTEDSLEIGDYILHNGGWCRVIDVDECGRLVVEKIMSHEVVTVLATKNVFGFEFFTKLVSIFGDNFTATKENPFGNMLPLMLMDDKSNMKDMLMMSMLSGGKFDMSNPMMMMCFMGDGENDMFKMMAMMQMMQPKHKCSCGQQMVMEGM